MHVAIIMDGNGRWARRRGLPRPAGHRAGARSVDAIVEAAARRRIATLTLYAFSSANWRRPAAEVSALLGLFRRHLLTQTRRCAQQNIRLNVIGRRDRIDADLRRLVEHGERATAQCTGLHLRIAIDYSAQHSLMEACRHLHAAGEPDQRRFAECLARVDHSQPAPEVDLLIRTGGEKRLSDFLLWECAYAELHFVDCLWPDFDESAFDQALAEYTHRERRFGALPAAGRASHA